MLISNSNLIKPVEFIDTYCKNCKATNKVPDYYFKDSKINSLKCWNCNQTIF